MGIDLETIKAGDGCTFPKDGQIVVVHYVGMLMDGKTFDSSRDRCKPFSFQIGKGQVIRGWDEGIKKISVGQRVNLTCPPKYAYGKKGFPGVIPPDATLKFDIELLSIQ